MAAPPSVSVRDTGDIARGMGATVAPVNPQQAASAVGRGPMPLKIGESTLTNIGILQEIANNYEANTSDGPRSKGHRGTRRVPVYDEKGNLRGIQRVNIAGIRRGDQYIQDDAAGNHSLTDAQRKSSDALRINGNRGNHREEPQMEDGHPQDGSRATTDLIKGNYRGILQRMMMRREPQRR